MKEIYSRILADADPVDYLDLFLTPNTMQEIVKQTNLFVTQHLLSARTRLHGWQPVP